ncbi:MAG: substrate-CoA ligase [Caulobacter sp.]|nr:substrate-CoA ligase [Caulobacter sp.]
MSDGLPGGPPRLVRLSDYVGHYASTRPESEAVVFGAQRLTYAQLDLEVDRCARALARAGVGLGDRVAMLTTPRTEFIVTLMATLRLGAVWIGINPRYRLEEMAHILDDSRPRVFLSLLRDPDGRDYRPDLVALKARPWVSPFEIITFPDRDDAIGPSLADLIQEAQGDCRPAPHTASPTDAAVIVYTSGTTGRPKGAVLGHGALVYAYEAVSRSFVGKEYVREGMRILCNLPPNHIGCLSEMVGNTIIRGGALILADRFNPAEAIAAIARERVTVFGGVPAMLQMVVQDPAFATADLSSLKMIGWGGAPAPAGLVSILAGTGAHLFTNYGLTEGGAIVSATPPDSDLETLATTVGAPVDLMEHRLALEEGGLAPPGEIGEIQLRGPGLFLGYWNDPAATAAALTRDGWLKTGDLAYATPEGLWTLKGRRGEMFKSGGYNIYPREIEQALEEHPDVALATVVEIPDPLYFEVGHAFVCAHPGARPSERALIAHLKERLANYKAPKRIHVLAAMPMLPIGKVDKHRLREIARGGAA